MTTRTHACLRWMINRDLPRILEIDESSFEYPWSEEEIIACVKQSNNIGMVAEVNEDVVGYMIYEMRKKEIEILVFAVHPKYRRSGIGGALIGRLICKLIGQRSKIVVAVQESNLQAQLFLRNMGFLCTHVEKDCYDECDEDSYVMQYFIYAE